MDKWWVKVITVIVSVLLFAGLFSLLTDSSTDYNGVPKPSENIKSVTTSIKDYSINIPGNWSISEGIMGTDLVAMAPLKNSDDLFRENINVISAKFKYPIKREDYYKFNMESLNELLEDFDLETSEDMQIGDLQVRKLIFTHTIGVINAKVVQYLILENNNAYVMTFTADPIDFKDSLDGFAVIANSFRIN